MQEQLKMYEDKMNKSLEVLLSEYTTITMGQISQSAATLPLGMGQLSTAAPSTAIP